MTQMGGVTDERGPLLDDSEDDDGSRFSAAFFVRSATK